MTGDGTMQAALITQFGWRVLLQLESLRDIPDDVAAQLHLYIVCRRPRVTVDPASFVFRDQTVSARFFRQEGHERIPIDVTVPNYLGTDDLLVTSEYPNTEVTISSSTGEVLSGGKAALLLGLWAPSRLDLLDLEVLYVGQSWGDDDEPTRDATARLAAHETLLAVYREVERTSPDQEVWLLLLSLDDPLGIMGFGMGSGGLPLSDLPDSIVPLLTERQYVAFTEAALIRHFRPEFNNKFKHTFPNPAHKSYRECYEVNLNSVGFELVTDELPGVRLYSPYVAPTWYHLPNFALHDPAERRSMFDFATRFD